MCPPLHSRASLPGKEGTDMCGRGGLFTWCVGVAAEPRDGGGERLSPETPGGAGPSWPRGRRPAEQVQSGGRNH